MARTSYRIALAAILLGIASLAGADETPLFDYREITLDNGLRVVTLEDFSAPIVAAHLWYHVGSKDEHPERTGFAHMFEHMMFRGTDRLGPTDHFDYIRQTGGTCNAYTAFDQTVYVQTLPANQLELALWLEAERMGFLNIDQESFDTERKVVEEERRLGLNQPYGDVPEKVLPKIIKDHPYRWLPIGNIAHLRAAAVQELRDFWMRYYVPNNATLVIVGAVKHEEAQRLAKQYFGWLPRYDDPPRVTVEEPLPQQATEIDVKSKNAPAPVTGVVFRTVPQAHEDYVPLQMLASILGGGESSRLYRRLVANERSASMAVAAAFSLEQDGVLAAGAVLPPIGGSIEEAARSIDEEIARIRKEGVTESELEKARNQMLAGIVRQNLTVASKASVLGSAAVLEGDTSRVNRQLEDVRRVTRDDLLRVANEYLAPNRAFAITVQRNLLGTLGSFLGLGGKSEEDAPITAEPETNPPPPGRPGLERPERFPQDPPLADPLEYDPTPKFYAAELPNGMQVRVVENHEVPWVSLRLGLESGAWTEDEPGAASMALSMLTKGTDEHSEAELAEELDRYAISLSGSAGMDSSSVYASCVSEHVPRAIRLMAEVVRTPTFPGEEFDKLQQQVLTGLTISSKKPSYLANRELRRRLYGEHPYSRTATGEIEDVQTLTVEHAQSWWRKFARPDQATLIFAGDIEEERALNLARDAFGDWTVEQPAPQVALNDIPPTPETQVYLVDYPGMQSQIRVGQIGLTRHDPEYFTGLVTSSYFGGAFNARLNETIRVKKGLTYGARGGWSADRFAGEFSISTFSKNASTAEAVRAILEEIERLQNEPPSAEELSEVKSYMLGSFPSRRETPQQVAGDVWLMEIQDLPADYFQRLVRSVASMTAEQCVQLAQQRVDPERMVVVVVGPASQLREELSEIAPVTVVQASESEPAATN